MNQDIVNVIKAYENSLNTSDTQAALALYGDDPVFMPQFSAALSGRDAVKAGYDHVFDTIKLNASFTIHEIVEMGDLAYVRTTSAGKTEILKNKATVQEANNELFIFRKEKGKWNILLGFKRTDRRSAAIVLGGIETKPCTNADCSL
jgi:uncharacterized protein (TIGR02246 family)